VHCSTTGKFDVFLNSKQFTFCSDPNAAVCELGDFAHIPHFKNIHSLPIYRNITEPHLYRTNVSLKCTHVDMLTL